MPQLSLYIDEKTLRKLEAAASIEKVSVSKYAVRKLNEALNSGWPVNYDSLFGSIQDESFVAESAAPFESDVPREKL